MVAGFAHDELLSGVTTIRTVGELKMPPEMIRAVCDKAHAHGYLVSAHVESPEGVRVALENGVDSIEHGAKLDDDMIRLFKERSIKLLCHLYRNQQKCRITMPYLLAITASLP